MKKANVVIQTAFIGDLFLSIPMLTQLKKKYPSHEIVLICKKGLKDFFLNEKIVDHIFEIEKNKGQTYSDVLQKINQFDIDNLLCLHQSVRSAIFSLKIKAKNKIGFSTLGNRYNWKRLIFSKLVIYKKKWPDAIRQMSILESLDDELKVIIQSNDWSYLNYKNKNGSFEKIPDFFKFPILKNRILNNFNTNKKQKKIAIFPGSVWATKKWTHLGFAEISKKLTDVGYQIYILGGIADLSDANEVQKLSPQSINLAGKMSLYESAMYIQDFDLIICNDSAPAHIAAALQRPVLALFGPTVLDFGFRPWNNYSQVVEIENLKCRPCGPHGNQQCPLGHHDCMKKINSELVFKTALDVLKLSETI